MKVYEKLSEFKIPDFPVVTSGTFDGVHIGHKKILERLVNVSKSVNGESVILTFWPHPRFVIYPEEKALKLLSTFEEKAAILESYGVDHLIKLRFTPSFAQLSSKEFIKQILVDGIGTKILLIGYDHKFGKNREGNFQHLVEKSGHYGFRVEEIPRQDIDNIGVSSSKTRKALLNGDIKTGNQYLGRPYSFSGKVVKGDQIGRQLGFPTANIEVNDPSKLIPGVGIYAVKVEFKGHLHNGMLYIGSRPTLRQENLSIEVNIFDFDLQIYNQEIRIYFYSLLRKDVKFDNLDQLKVQLQKDKKAATDVLN